MLRMPVGSNYSCGEAIIVLEETSEATATSSGAVALFAFLTSLREKQFVAFPLMVSFAVIMRAELGQGPRQRAFAEQNQLRQTLLLGGPNPTFRKGVQIRTSGGKRPGLHTACRQHGPKRCAELRVTIVQNITASIQISPGFSWVALRAICSIHS